ncbi:MULTISPECIES: ABC transporter permease [unclassified Roseitalea]|uniref:ABC transporter permease n=1 Tax=unclassified Roseitalea TaxID=2639107 RepID=UPI00273F05BD|nr:MULTISPECIES: ABC transporter permease [unclassified Roseitalea]
MSARPATGLLPRLRVWPRRAASDAMLIAGLAMAGLLAVLTLLFGLNPPESAYTGNLMSRFQSPSLGGHVFGTDQLGRSLGARLAAGMPWSLGIALVAAIIALSIGTVMGLIAAWLPGWPRRVIRTVVDTVIAFPSLVIAVTVIALLGRGFWPLAVTLGLATWPIAARVVYAEAMSIVKRDYVVAAVLAGVGPVKVLATHVLPALRPTLLTMFAFTFADMLIAESALSFLGLGVPLSAPSWGNMLAESREHLVAAPWMMLVPAGAIVFAVVALNLIGDGIAASARKRGRAIG